MGYHIPVLLNESVSGLVQNPDGVYVDLTFGGGGHSKGILQKLSAQGKLFAFDQDEDALANSIDDPRFRLTRSNFRYFRNFLRYYGEDGVDGILADLGVSSHHFDSPERGFSFRFKGALDMRMNQLALLTAARVVNDYPEERMREILWAYGELSNAKKLAGAICSARLSKPIETSEELANLLSPAFPAAIRSKMLAKAFQAIRIEVNGEMEALRETLLQALRALKPSGRLVVISYHSLEDRLVKNFIRSGNFDGTVERDFFGNVVAPMEQVERKAITPSEEELEQNPRSRSAKLRVGRKR